MKGNSTYQWSPEPGNIIQEAFAEILKVYTAGVTKNQWICLYGAFLGGMIMALSSQEMQAPLEEMLALIRAEGKIVTAMMEEENRQNQNN